MVKRIIARPFNTKFKFLAHFKEKGIKKWINSNLKWIHLLHECNDSFLWERNFWQMIKWSHCVECKSVTADL